MSSQVGLSEYAKTAALAALFPNAGTTYWIALLTTLPTDSTGTGLVEATGSGYARISNNAWTPGSNPSGSGDTTYVVNTNSLTFATLTGDLSGVVGFAIYDAETDGNLMDVGELTDSDYNPITRNYVTGDSPNFPAEELIIGLTSENGP